MASKGKEDLQIISSACAVTLLAALRAAFMFPQQRRAAKKSAVFGSEFSRLAAAGAVEAQAEGEIPISAGPSPRTPACAQKSLFENLPMILYRSLEVSAKEEGGRECAGKLAGGQIILP